MVTEFLKAMPAEPGAYIFTVVTYAGYPGATINAVSRALAARNLKLAAGYGVKMISNFPPMGGAPEEEKRNKKLAAAAERVEKVAAQIAEGRRGHVEKAFILVDLVSRAMSGGAAKGFKKADKKFFADDKCVSCGTCARVCPTADIEIVAGRPQWQGRCAQCFACMFWCPEKAIHFGKVREGLVHYHHPEITRDEMLLR